MLRQRLITALILLLVVSCLIFLTPQFVFQITASLVLLAATWEWGSLLGSKDSLLIRILLIILVVMGFLEALFFALPIWILAAGAVMVAWAFAAVLSYGLNRKPVGFQFPLLRVLACLVLMASTLIGLVLLRAKPNGPGLAFYALSLAFVNDSSAYFLGRWIGKKKLAPRVSPKKTWEGCICGILIGTIWSILITIIFWSNSLSILSMIIVTVPTLIAAVIGDLFISVLKRESNLKDTGKLLPGHGGLLDRIDAILMAIPIFALVALQVGIL